MANLFSNPDGFHPLVRFLLLLLFGIGANQLVLHVFGTLSLMIHYGLEAAAVATLLVLVEYLRRRSLYPGSNKTGPTFQEAAKEKAVKSCDGAECRKTRSQSASKNE